MNQAAPLSATERRDRLRLARSENVGPVTYFALLQRFGTAGAALEALPALAKRGGRARPIKVPPPDAARRELAAIEKLGARLIAHGEADYPAPLAAIADPPPLITVRGRVDLLQELTVAIVGARNASANGARLARRLAAELGANGIAVVSGLARGIDTNAHQGALESGTVAVVAGGADVVYPAENQALFDDIVERGAVVSEMPLGTVPQARHFPRRNRIISGLSRGVVVVEAAPRSGSLISARLALEQGREVFAVPGSPLDPRSRGTNNLIRQGATLTESAADIMAVLSEASPRPLAEPEKAEFSSLNQSITDESALPRARSAVTQLLGPAPTPVDELVRQSRLTPAVVVTILLELELAGRLERSPGNQVFLIDTDE